jgi:hypothetical protein
MAFRAKAARTGKLVGIKRGVLRDEKGRCTGAWCEVYRSDWQHPAREEVSLAEYSTGKAMWAKMPETMVKKVAEVAALRMAFPDDLGGVYAEEEMHQAEVRDIRPKEIQAKLEQSTASPEFEASDYFASEEHVEDVPGPGEYVVKVGKNKGRHLKHVAPKDMENFCRWYDQMKNDNKPMHADTVEYFEMICAYQATLEAP